MKVKFKNTKIDFEEVVDVYDYHGTRDREVEVLGYDSNGNEYTATGMESCGSIVEVYTETIEDTGMNRSDYEPTWESELTKDVMKYIKELSTQSPIIGTSHKTLIRLAEKYGRNEVATEVTRRLEELK